MSSLLSGKADKVLSVSVGPHLHAAHSTSKILWGTFLALLPIWLNSLLFFGWDVLRVFLVALGSGAVFELLFRVLIGKKPKLLNGSTVLVSALLALLLPPSIPSWVVLFGCFVAVVLGKEVFGGLGQNIFNPILVGYATLLVLFPRVAVDGVTQTGISLLVIPFCGAILLVKKWIPREVPLLYLLAIALSSFLLGHNPPTEQIFDGQVLLCAFFLVVDSATTPITRDGRILFAVGAGILFSLFRFWMSVSEAMASSVLLMNAAVPLLDRFSQKQGKQY